MGPQDDFGLQEAIKTTLVQLCKVGVIYHCELSIAGTVGVTVDRKKTILVHFDERLDPCQPDTSNSISNKDLNETFTNAVANQASSSLNLMASNMGLPCSLAQTPVLNGPYVDLANFSPVGSSSTKNEAYSQTLQTSIPIPIDIDSDSESLSELRFEDDVIEVDPPSSMVKKREVMWSGEDDVDAKIESKCNLDIKTSISNQVRVETIARLMAGFTGPVGPPMPSSGDMSMPAHSTQIQLQQQQHMQQQQHLQQQQQQHTQQLPPQNTATAPVKLLVDKRLFLKKASPEKTPAKSPKVTKTRQTRSQTKKKKSPARSTAVSSPPPASSPPQAPTSSGYMELPSSPPAALSSNLSNFNCNIPKEHFSNKPKLSCEVCSKNFPTQGLLEAHLVEAHGVVESLEIGEIVHYTCKHCKKKFRYQATLDKHEFLHVAAKPHKCDICGNTYCYAESLQIHMNTHAGILDCPICQKMYSSRKHLQKHIVYMHEMRRVRNGATPKKALMSVNLHEPEDNDDEENPDKPS